jgi:uncharacterized phage infection (PIP) family protein YhgE
MIRRAMLAVFFVIFVVPSAWPKFKEDEQQYLNDKFKAIEDQVTALTTLLQTLNAQLQVLRQNQAQFQAVIDHQQQALQNLDQLVTSMHLGDEENFSVLKTAITQLRKDTKAAIASLSGVQPGSATTEATKPGSENPPRVLQGYVTDVKGNPGSQVVTLEDMGSAQGIRQGSRLAVYKASDPNTRVGVIEITQVIDAETSHAQIVTLNAGVQLAWGDVVRLE